MNTIILVSPPDRHKGPLCLCKSSDCSQCSQYVPRSSSASVLPCNNGFNTHTAPCPLYEGKDQDGKCRFEPVAAIASTQVSSVGVTIRYYTSSSASASNCIHALGRMIILLPCPRVMFHYVISAKCR